MRMHILIMQPPEGVLVDHRNFNTCFNRRENLRLSTHSENTQHQRLRSDNTSGYKGVTYYPRYGLYRAYIGKEGRRYHLGYFADADEAAEAYNSKAMELHGEFAGLNVVKRTATA
jgi:hypothetical protein